MRLPLTFRWNRRVHHAQGEFHPNRRDFRIAEVP